MEQKNKEKTYWPHMIVGFLLLGLTLGYWTIKSASSMPVERENKYMMSYQNADMNYNEIMKNENAFNDKYIITIEGVEIIKVEPNKNSKLKLSDPIKLNKGANSFTYKVMTKDGTIIKDVEVSFLLTRPHTDMDDQKIDTLSFDNGVYVTPELNIEKIGRYTLVLRAQIGEDVGFYERPAFLEKD
jgi:hypothetical protein